MKHQFKAIIYKTGINWAVDVPSAITGHFTAIKGYIRIKGKINGFDFRKSLVPVKNSDYRLFVNLIMMKGGNTAVGKIADFELEQDFDEKTVEIYAMPDFLAELLQEQNLRETFDGLSGARKRDILRYITNIKSAETRQRNLEKLIHRLRSGIRDVRIP
jgi:hypothetical protein